MGKNVITLVAGLLFIPATANAGIVLGQLDDFQDGTVQNWDGAAGFFGNVGGGAGGASDRFLQVSANQGGGPGSRVATFNQTQWAGDYLAAGVTAIQVDMANLGSTDLEMRALFLFSPGGDFTSTTSQLVPADGVWRTYTFGLTAGDLTKVSAGGTGLLTDTLSAVGRLLFRHQTGAPAGMGGGTVVQGTVGLDNIIAIPEPSSGSLFVIFALAMMQRRRHRRLI